jgi:hypothetical protein
MAVWLSYTLSHAERAALVALSRQEEVGVPNSRKIHNREFHDVISFVDQNQGGEIFGACATYGSEEKCTQNSV